MLFDIGLVICCLDPQGPLPELIHSCISQFNEKGLSHEFILVCDARDETGWERIEQLSKRYTAIRAFAIQHRNQLESMALCGCMYAQSRVVVTMDDSGRFEPSSILVLHAAITQSNCDLIYGRMDSSDHSIGRLWSKARRLVFSMLSGLSSEISSYRMIKAHSLEGLKIRTPYRFSFDQLIKSGLHNHSHLFFKGKTGKNPWRNIPWYTRVLVIPFAWTYLAESCIVALLASNIYLLLHGRLVLALMLATLALVLLWIAYMVKWRRGLAFRITRKIVR